MNKSELTEGGRLTELGQRLLHGGFSLQPLFGEGKYSRLIINMSSFARKTQCCEMRKVASLQLRFLTLEEISYEE